MIFLKKLNLELNDANEKKKELHEEVTDLKQQNRLQRERLQSSQQENEFSKSEIDNLKKSLSQVKQVCGILSFDVVRIPMRICLVYSSNELNFLFHPRLSVFLKFLIFR